MFAPKQIPKWPWHSDTDRMAPNRKMFSRHKGRAYVSNGHILLWCADSPRFDSEPWREVNSGQLLDDTTRLRRVTKGETIAVEPHPLVKGDHDPVRYGHNAYERSYMHLVERLYPGCEWFEEAGATSPYYAPIHARLNGHTVALVMPMRVD